MVYHRRRADNLSWVQRNFVVLLTLTGMIVTGAIAFGHLEQHVWDQQKQIDKQESRIDFLFGK